MALDIIARAAAAAARSDAAQALVRADPLDLFANIGSKSIDPAITRLSSRGYDTLGAGLAFYVSDSMADATLAANHPRFCKATANGRYFRLAGEYVTVEQAGAKGTGNDQPAVQAAVDYALAIGIREVRFTRAGYDLWIPDYRALTSSVITKRGCINIGGTGNLELVGLASGTRLTIKGYAGGDINTQTQTTTDGQTWRGSLLQMGYSGAPVLDSLTLRNLYGTAGYVWPTNGNTDSDVSNKGVSIQQDKVKEVYVYNCTFTGFRGEVFYVGGGALPSYVYVENLRLYESAQALWNPGNLAKVVAVNLDCEGSYQPAEVIGGLGHTYIGGRFARGNTNTFLGLSQFTGSYPYWWPARDTTKAPPWISFNGTRFEAAGPVGFTSWCRGTIVTVDSAVSLGAFAARDVDLDIEAWCDVGSGSSAVSISGPSTLTAQVAGAPVGIFYPKCQTHRVRVTCRRTEAARTANRAIDAFTLYGLFDHASCRFEAAGEVRYAFAHGPGNSLTPVAGYAQPTLVLGPISPITGALGGSSLSPAAGATTTVDLVGTNYVLTPPTAGTATITLGSTLSYMHGQRVIFIHNQNSTGRLVLFPQGGAGLALERSRTLYAYGDLLELEFDSRTGKWHEVRYETSQGGAFFTAPQVLADGATVTPNLGLGQDFEWTIAGNRTLANPTNALAGMTGTLRVTQDATGSRVVTYGTNWRFPGGAAGGVLSTAANAVDVIRYTVGSDGMFYCRLDKALA